MSKIFHITLKDEVANDPDKRQQAFDRVVRECQVSPRQNQQRLQYGIISARVEDSQLAALRAMPEVQDIEEDSDKFAT